MTLVCVCVFLCVMCAVLVSAREEVGSLGVSPRPYLCLLWTLLSFKFVMTTFLDVCLCVYASLYVVCSVCALCTVVGTAVHHGRAVTAAASRESAAGPTVSSACHLCRLGFVQS